MAAVGFERLAEALEALTAAVAAEGRGLSIQATAAAGTSPLVVIGALWAEVPA